MPQNYVLRYSRLDGGNGGDDIISSSSLLRLLPLLLGPAPLFAEAILERSGELEIVSSRIRRSVMSQVPHNRLRSW